MRNIPLALVPGHIGTKSKEDLRRDILGTTLQAVIDNLTRANKAEADHSEPAARDNIALSMGFNDFAGLQTALDQHRKIVSAQFDALFADNNNGEHPLAALWTQATGSANRVARWLLLTEPPSIDLGEITDKGSINQRAVLKHREAVVQSLHDGSAPGIQRPQPLATQEHP